MLKVMVHFDLYLISDVFCRKNMSKLMEIKKQNWKSRYALNQTWTFAQANSATGLMKENV